MLLAQESYLMAEKSLYAGVQKVARLSSNVGQKCNHCSERVGLEKLAESINHYIQRHGYKLLHVGQETSHDADGHPWHSTVAVLGNS